MTLPGTIPEDLLSCEWGWQLKWSLRVVPATSRMLDGGFVNRAVKLYLTMLFMKPPEIVPVKAMEQPEAGSFVISVV